MGTGAEVIRKPNSHSSAVATVAAGSRVTTLGRALADYVYVRTSQGSKGYLKRGQLSGEIPCPAEEETGY